MKVMLSMFIVFLMLLPLGVAFAEEAADGSGSAAEICGDECVLQIPNLHGEVTLSGQVRPVSGNSTKYNEYRDDARGNVFGEIKLKYDNDLVWLYLKASDIGYDTQHYRLEGGVYGIVKYYLDFNETPHNLSLDDRTIYNGIGSNNLTTIPSYQTRGVGTWNDIDFGYIRSKESIGARLDAAKPFYLDFNASRETKVGTRLLSATQSNGSSGPINEFPQPIDYTTSLFKAEAGYLTKPLFVSAYVQFTDFSNGSEDLFFQNTYTGAPVPSVTNASPSRTINSRAGLTDTITLPPGNQNFNYGLKGAASLPLNSRLNVSLSNSETTSSANYLMSSLIGTSITLPSPAYAYTYANGGTDWHGKTDTQSYNVVLNSNPIPELNTSLFYKYRSLLNKSDDPTTVSNTGNTSLVVPVNYYRNDAGFDASYKLPEHFILSGGFNYVVTNNSVSLTGLSGMTEDIPRTTDNIYNVGLKWAGVDFLSAKVGYERMNRNGANDINIASVTDTFAIYKNEYDVGTQKRDRVKASVDVFPLESLDIGLGYNYKRSVYPDTQIGLQNTRTDEYYVDAGYTFGKYARLNGYVALENYKTYQFFRTTGTSITTCVNNVCSNTGIPTSQDPNSTIQNAANYNFDLTLRDVSLDYGMGLDVYVIPKKVTLKLKYDSVHSYGTGDYTILNQAALAYLGNPASTTALGGVPAQNNDNVDYPSLDSYKVNRIQASVVWNVMKPLTATLGYAWERYKYADYGYDNYPSTYTIVDAGGNVNYLTGAYSNPNYTANLVYLTLTYKF
ncbi:MAG: MtrB/PioB family outer membrane beta-barrel protein [Nitrospirae bacterium]|nr:MtrB/PioB family outer membrane beta-barrel protein [Nitrospirota bacterium]